MARVKLQTLLDRSNKNMASGTHAVVRETALEVIKRAYKEGINVQISEGHRSYARQNELYAQGRTKPGNIVTNAKGGQSWHNFGIAVDYFLTNTDGSKAVWTVNNDWRRVAQIGKSLGFEWGGDWTSFKDYPHLQMTGGYTLAQLRNGAKPKLTSKVNNPTPAPAPQPSNSVAGAKLVKNENAFFLATENIKVRNAPSVTAKHTGTLPKGSSINYKKVYEGNGYRWLQYVGNSGNVLYLPYRESGSGKEQWGTFHSTRPSGGSVAKPAPAKKSVSQMATEVIAGKHGSGHANRRKSLGITQAEYDKVRAEVNKRAGVSSGSSKSVSQMATEVIAGKHGNGHAQRQKSLGVNNATYQKVRAEVNRRS